jgi:hypothetical protein
VLVSLDQYAARAFDAVWFVGADVDAASHGLTTSPSTRDPSGLDMRDSTSALHFRIPPLLLAAL